MNAEAQLAALARLHAIATGYIRQGDITAVLEAALEAAMSIVGADRATLHVVDDPTGALKVAAHRGHDAAEVEHLSLLHPAPWARTLAQERPVVIEDLVAGIRTSRWTALRHSSGKVMGVLALHHHAPHRPDDDQLRLLDLLATQCGDALERARWAAECAVLAARAQHDSEQRFRNTVENIPLNLVLYDREFRVLYMNPTLAAICAAYCKVPPAELSRLKGAEVWPAAIWGPLQANTLRALETGERQTYELDFTIPGRPRTVRQWIVVPLTDSEGRVSEIMAMSHDITPQRLLLEEVREADRRKSEFIAVLSHELRNPLAAIRSSLFVLEAAAPTGAAEARARGIIDRQMGQLIRIVDDLLDVSRITQNKIQLQRRRLDINQLVRCTVEDGRAHLEASGLRVEMSISSTPLHVDADEARIVQVVTNLLSNATKFTPAGGMVTVVVAVDDVRRRALIRVHDTGAGLDPALLQHLFQPFMQAARTLDRAAGGLGLGLALIKGLVELHGGDVVARSAGRNLGAEFTVSLPLAPAAAAPLVAAPGADVGGEGRRVLIIEDNADVAMGLRNALTIFHHEAEVADNGLDGIAKALVFRPDVLLCDIGLPGIDGYEVARRFRADERLCATVLVALSGFAQPGDVERARAAGFDLHLAKPAPMKDILRILEASGASESPRSGDA